MYMMKNRDAAEISITSKSRLAKLLAAENIHVEHRSVSTAMFDVKNRVLILPMWKDITNDLYDLLVLHETGHALFTPLDGWHGAASTRPKHFKGFLNITEDARIEKKMKRKFPGGRRSFVNGYVDLMDRDFFGLKDRPVNTLNLIDRINIHTKAGLASGVQFSYEEAPFVRMVEDAETFEEAEAAAVAIYEYMGGDSGAMTDTNPTEISPDDGDTPEEDGETTEVEVPDDGENEDEEAPSGENDGEAETEDNDTSDDGDEDEKAPSGGNDGDSDEDEENDTSGESTGDSDDEDETNGSGTAGGRDGEGGEGGSTLGDEPRSETDEAFRDRENELVDDEAVAITYTQIPRDEAFNLDQIVIPANVVHNRLLAYADDYSEEASDHARKEVAEFKAANTKTVNYLAKEFEMKKAAEASSRTSVSRTGVLDVNTLHSYKWNDDVFKRITNVPEGKSHGLVMFIDWSGSMSGNIRGSIDQVLNLVLFCKKVNIPFDVYGFSDAVTLPEYSGDRLDWDKMSDGDWTLRRDRFNLIQLATSTAKASDFQRHLMGLIMLRSGLGWGYDRKYCIPSWAGLGGTPLAEAMVSAIPVVNKFRKTNGLQIVNTVFLTDGDGAGLACVKDRTAPDGERRINSYNTIIRDPASRKEWDYGYYAMTRTLLDIFRVRTGSKIVNFFIVEDNARQFKRYWERTADIHDREASAAAWKEARAEGGVVIENNSENWDSYYMIPGGSSLAIDGDEGLSDDLIGAKKGQIKRAFAKAATGKLRNRVLLREFIGLIAA